MEEHYSFVEAEETRPAAPVRPRLTRPGSTFFRWTLRLFTQSDKNQDGKIDAQELMSCASALPRRAVSPGLGRSEGLDSRVRLGWRRGSGVQVEGIGIHWKGKGSSKTCGDREG